MTQEEIIFNYAMSLDGWGLQISGENISNVYSKKENDIKFEIQTGINCYLYVVIEDTRCYIPTPINCRKIIEDKANKILIKIKEDQDIKYQKTLGDIINKINEPKTT